jgi:F-type H+-transporting ATPase subunit alpha
VEILKQGQFSPLTVEKQIAIIYCGTKGLLRNVPVNKVREFESEFLAILEATHKDVLNALKAGKFDDSLTNVLESVAKDLSAKY